MQSLMFLGCIEEKIIEEKPLGVRFDPPPGRKGLKARM